MHWRFIYNFRESIINILFSFLFVSTALSRVASNMHRYRFLAKRYHHTGRSNLVKTVSFEEQGYITSHTGLYCCAIRVNMPAPVSWDGPTKFSKGIFIHANWSNSNHIFLFGQKKNSNPKNYNISNFLWTSGLSQCFIERTNDYQRFEDCM